MLNSAMARRGVLKLLGMAVASPVAMEVERTSREMNLLGGVTSGEDGCYADTAVNSDEDKRRRNVWRDIFKSKLPWWKEAQLRADAKVVRRLDADIASFKSFSMVAKVALQQERNYQSTIASIRDGYDKNEAEEAYLKDRGIRWL